MCRPHYEEARRSGLIQTRKKPQTCSVNGCAAWVQAKGLCDNHYRHFLKTGDPLKTPRDPEQRLWARVQRGAPDDCWPWRGALSNGYGRLRIPGGSVQAHRLAYELLVGPIPADRELDHLCRNTVCCNPAHLEPVTKAENILRGYGMAARWARRTHCERGHPLEGPEADVHMHGNTRVCRACTRARYAERKAKETGN